MIMMNLMKCFFKNGALGFVTLYNTIVSIIDIIFLIVSIVLLSKTDNGLVTFVGLVFLILAAIALPCVCCGICYIWSLFHIQNSLKMARFMGVCNFCFMILTFTIIATNIEKEKEIETPGLMAFFFILNIVSLISVIFLCSINCGFEETSLDSEIAMRHNPEPLTFNDIAYPYPLPTIQEISYPIMNNVVIEIQASAPSPSQSIYEQEGK